MLPTSDYLEVDKSQLQKYDFIDGLFLMGSRSEGDSCHSDESDIDCCIVVSQPIQYKDLYDVVSKSILESTRVELCPRTISQLQVRNKFNYDLKYLSKILYVRKTDIRNTIPLITPKDFSTVDIYSTLSSSLGLFMAALHEYFTAPNNSLKIIILLEKSFRKLSLFLNLLHDSYPAQKDVRHKVLFDHYSNQGLWLTNLSLLRENLRYENINLHRSILALNHIIKNELHVPSNKSVIDLDFIASTIADKEHLIFTKSILEIFLKISQELSLVDETESDPDLNCIRGLLINDYQSLISQDHFVPPVIINGGYHVFK